MLRAVLPTPLPGAGDGYTVDTARPVRVVTQFVTTDGTDRGELKEIRRMYLQDTGGGMGGVWGGEAQAVAPPLQ